MQEQPITKAVAFKLIALISAVLILCAAIQWLPVSAQSFFGLKLVGGSVLPAASLHADYRAELSVEGGVPPYHWNLERGHLPAGLELQGDGVIRGRAEVPGEYWLDVSVKDSSKNARSLHQSLLLPVSSKGVAVITSNSELPWARAGSEYVARLTAAGSMPPFFWKAEGALPPGMKLSAKGVLSGAPEQGGDFLLAVQVSNLAGEKARRTFSLHISRAQVDRFGGIMTPGAKANATGRWRTAKVGDRWVLMTPEGHPFWMIGVWFVGGDTHKDERGISLDQRMNDKYGSEPLKWLQANRRLRSWGFNAIGPYSYRMMMPMVSEPEWTGTEQPVKMPFIWISRHPAIRGRKEGVFKNLFAGADKSVSAVGDLGWANFPDVFDPAWVRNAQEVLNADHELATVSQSPYMIGLYGDDTDYLSGFGPGPEFASQPAGKTHPHLGYVALITAPTQEKAKESGAKYTDVRVHTKLRLSDFLRDRYRSIDALNSSWQANYTTFGSDGGWPGGKGLLDENGRGSHRWLGTGNSELLPSSGANPNMVRDLDDFLYLIARQYFTTERDAVRAIAPHALFFGPTTVGGWWAPARAPIYRAAGESLDAIGVTSDGSQGQLDFVMRAAGDLPLLVWEGVVANADSGLWRHARYKEQASSQVDTQAERAARYRRDVEWFFKARASNGVHPFIGHLLWAWTDSVPEEMNWGLVSLMDNAYDGHEAGKSLGTDAWGYRVGGEERNYGDFIGPVRAVNFSVMEQLAHERD